MFEYRFMKENARTRELYNNWSVFFVLTPIPTTLLAIVDNIESEGRCYGLHSSLITEFFRCGSFNRPHVTHKFVHLYYYENAVVPSETLAAWNSSKNVDAE